MSWNTTLFLEQYKAVGQEFYDYGINLVQGPVQGPLGRIPWGGRYPEALSPEPYLSGIAEGLAISGFQSAGVVTAGRHFLLNEQETNRMNGGYSANVDDKTINEVYLWPFADSVKAGMMSVMCAMNAANGTVSCENQKLLNGYLKTNIGFPGMVQPDVGGQSDALVSANSGLDYGSSRYWTVLTLAAGIKNDEFTLARLDDMATRIVLGYYFVGLDSGDQPTRGSAKNVRGNHSTIIREAARQSIVLLKNDNTGGGGLPLNKPETLSLFGAHAGPIIGGPNEPFSVSGTPVELYPGHLAGTVGSGEDSFPFLTDPYSAISQRVRDYDGTLLWILNDTYTTPFVITPPGGIGGNLVDNSTDGTSATNNTNAPPGGGGSPFGSSVGFKAFAAESDACICFINNWSGEGADRTQLSYTEQDEMINLVANNCNNTIVVANVAGPSILDGWITNENVRAVLYTSYLGQDSGNAITDVLFGDVNPSGKLTYTIAESADDYPGQICTDTECTYDEGVNIDYRYFDAENLSVRYPFGHGLSYTTFSHSGLTISITNKTAVASTYPTGRLSLGGKSDLFDDVITATATVTNTGSLAGAEVSQLYISFPDEAGQAPRILRGFAKTNLDPEQSAAVTFTLRRRDISYWDTVAQDWAIASGTYTFSVGASSRDLQVNQTLTI